MSGRKCDDCAFVGPIKYRGDERRCDYLMHRRAPEWITQWLNGLPSPGPQYGPASRAEECGAFEPMEEEK